ncbi:MAG: response regulator [Xenococcaceae cyanobacterium MO_188.B29]|nr:response regulator [Xenococcaceae cyanobacterium MO_188.B29]
MNSVTLRPIEILLVEDSPSDAKLIKKVFDRATIPHHLEQVEDGIEALDFLYQQGEYGSAPRPDMILLDLHLPKKDGLCVLAEIKADSQLSKIPVIVLTTSHSPKDVINCYQMDANCYLTKPNNLQEFKQTVSIIEDFWLGFVKLPL